MGTKETLVWGRTRVHRTRVRTRRWGRAVAGTQGDGMGQACRCSRASPRGPCFHALGKLPFLPGKLSPRGRQAALELKRKARVTETSGGLPRGEGSGFLLRCSLDLLSGSPWASPSQGAGWTWQQPGHVSLSFLFVAKKVEGYCLRRWRKAQSQVSWC